MTREELYKLVWSQPTSKVARTLGVSGSYLARVCTALAVPRPKPGYWQKKKAGTSPAPPALEPASIAAPIRWQRSGANRPALKQYYKAASLKRKLGGGISDGELLVKQTEYHLRNAAENALQLDTYLAPPIRRPLIVDIVTSPEGLENCLQFTRTLFQELERRGHIVVIAGSADKARRAEISTLNPEEGLAKDVLIYKCWCARPTMLFIDRVALGIAVVEMSKSTKLRYIGYSKFVPVEHAKKPIYGYSWTSVRQQPSRLIKLAAYSPLGETKLLQQWCENKRGHLKRLVPDIVNELESLAKKQHSI